jgi:hypothetical protein
MRHRHWPKSRGFGHATFNAEKRRLSSPFNHEGQRGFWPGQKQKGIANHWTNKAIVLLCPKSTRISAIPEIRIELSNQGPGVCRVRGFGHNDGWYAPPHTPRYMYGDLARSGSLTPLAPGTPACPWPHYQGLMGQRSSASMRGLSNYSACTQSYWQIQSFQR